MLVLAAALQQTQAETPSNIFRKIRCAASHSKPAAVLGKHFLLAQLKLQVISEAARNAL